MSRTFKVEITGRDQIELKLSEEGVIQSLELLGCSLLQTQMNFYVQKYGLQISNWSVPIKHDHASLLIKEMILKAQNKWNFPIEDEELCHCRNVKTDLVKMAILSGAHDPDSVSRQTSAATGCGTCKKDIEKILEFHLDNNEYAEK